MRTLKRISELLDSQILSNSPMCWSWHFRRTSGALKPRVPARLARQLGLRVEQKKNGSKWTHHLDRLINQTSPSRRRITHLESFFKYPTLSGGPIPPAPPDPPPLGLEVWPWLARGPPGWVWVLKTSWFSLTTPWRFSVSGQVWWHFPCHSLGSKRWTREKKRRWEIEVWDRWRQEVRVRKGKSDPKKKKQRTGELCSKEERPSTSSLSSNPTLRLFWTQVLPFQLPLYQLFNFVSSSTTHLSQSKITENSFAGSSVIQKVSWFDVSMHDTSLMSISKSVEEAAKVVLHVRDWHDTVVILRKDGWREESVQVPRHRWSG